MIQDGLWCGHGDTHMGITAENVAAKHGLTREAQDAFALQSQQRAAAAQAAGAFDREIFTVTLAGKKGDVAFNRDEYIKTDATAEGLAKLKPAFKKDGTVTAGNASGINDGAAALVLASEGAAKAHRPIARILGFAQAGVDPATMGLGPVPAIQKLLQKTGVKLADIDLFELNEAFAAQSLGVLAELPGLDPAKVNRARRRHRPRPSHRRQRHPHPGDPPAPAPGPGQEARPRGPLRRRRPGRGHAGGTALIG